MNRKRIWGWWMFDWASQPYFTLGITFIFGPYFAQVASEVFLAEGMTELAADARAQSLWSRTQWITGLLIAVTAPVLGALADNSGRRMPWIAVFSLCYILGSVGLWMLLPDGSNMTLVLLALAIGLIGVEFTTIFTNAMLPDLGPETEIGRISGTGFAIGYTGGVLALVIVLVFLAEGDTGRTLIGLEPALGLDPEMREGTRAVGPFIAVWFIVFMIPFFLWVRDTPKAAQPGGTARALSQLVQTLRAVPSQPSLFAYLGSSLFYRDALVALYGFGGTYAVLVLNWDVTQVGAFGIIGAVTSALATWISGRIDSAIGPKPLIVATVIILIGVCTVIFALSPNTLFGVAISPDAANIVFFVCGATIGGAGGVLQASSRTMMVRHANPDRPTEAFGLYALAGKAMAFMGPLLVDLATSLTGSVRLGMTPLVGLFVISLVLLIWVHPHGLKGGKATA